MIVIDNTIVSDDLRDVHFVCNPQNAKAIAVFMAMPVLLWKRKKFQLLKTASTISNRL